ncbi:hypothetical protein EGW08_000895, partial [Elysia chlorotica]
MGDRCENHCDQCKPNPCYNGATCNPDGRSYTCTCRVDTSCTYTWNNTLRFTSDPMLAEFRDRTSLPDCEDDCTANLNCVAYQFANTSTTPYCLHYKQLTFGDENTAGVFSYTKSCVNTQLFEGPRCEVDLRNDCTNTVCSESDFCKDLVDKTECVCPSEGNYDENCKVPTDLCEGNPCGSHGTCQAFGSVRYICFCEPGFTGLNCDKNIQECELNPAGCLYGGKCVDNQGGYTCSCPDGFSGTHCQHRPDLCESNACGTDSGGFCIEDFRRISANCTCGEHYDLVSSDVCEKTDYCLTEPCVNGTCSSQFDSYDDDDDDDHSQSSSFNHVVYISFLITGPTCDQNINDCVGVCTTENTVDSRDLINDCECVCKPGFTGKNCSEDIDECNTVQPCLHGGKCKNTLGDYTCDCETGWTGKNCQNNTDLCGLNYYCGHGTCYNLQNNSYCRCVY